MFNLINENLLEKKENAKKAEAALNDINKICAKYADKKKLLKYGELFESEMMDLTVNIPLEEALDTGW